MDFNKLPGSLPGLGDTFGKLFPNADGQYSKEEFSKMQECAEMLEKYVGCFPKTKGCAEFSQEDKASREKVSSRIWWKVARNSLTMPSSIYPTKTIVPAQTASSIHTSCSTSCIDCTKRLSVVWDNYASFNTRNN